MSHQVFVSYPAGDRQLVDALCRALEQRGIRCLAAPRDGPVAAGQPEPTGELVAASRVLLLVGSPEARWTEEARRQVLLAAWRGAAVIPVAIGGAGLAAGAPPSVPPRAGPGFSAAHLEELAESVARLVAGVGPEAGAKTGPWAPAGGDRRPDGGIPRHREERLEPRGACRGVSSRRDAALGLAVLAVAVTAAVMIHARDRQPLHAAARSPAGERPSAACPRVVGVPVRAGSTRVAGTWVNPGDGMTFVFVPAGPAVLGSDGGPVGEAPRHTVWLPAYWIGKHEVTLGQFRKFMAATRHVPAGDIEANGSGDRLPVVNVSWRDAAAYCEWAGVRLPTEAEWEKAARGACAREYPWGEAWDPARCNSAERGPGKPVPAGSCPGDASPYGCLDMAGNVREWCSSAYKPYPYRADDGREDEGGDVQRVNRGGAFNILDGPYLLRSAQRNSDDPDESGGDIGFRCAVSAR